jgi:hypothetical protein
MEWILVLRVQLEPLEEPGSVWRRSCKNEVDVEFKTIV